MGRSLEKAEKRAAEIRSLGQQALVVSADVLSKASIEQAHELIKNTFRPVDILIHGAGDNDLKATTSDEYFYPLALETEGAFALHPYMKQTYDLKVFYYKSWIKQYIDIYRRNGLKRLWKFMSKWIPNERKYVKDLGIIRQCDIMIHS